MSLPGVGILQGLFVTAWNFVGSFFDRARSKRLITEQYPEERPKLPENSRTFPFLIYDGDDPVTGIRCTACGICIKECPAQCMYLEQARSPEGKPLRRPSVFTVDISVCMSCQICAEVCPFESIRIDQIYEWSSTTRPPLLTLEKMLKPNSYYHEIRPVGAQETDDRIEAVRKKKELAAKAAAAHRESIK